MSDFSYSQQYFLGKLKDFKKKALNNDDASKYRPDFILLRKELKYFIHNTEPTNKPRYISIDTDIVRFCDNHDIFVRGFFEQIAHFLMSLFSSKHKISTPLNNICNTAQLKPKNYQSQAILNSVKKECTMCDSDKKEFEEKFSHYLDMI